MAPGTLLLVGFDPSAPRRSAAARTVGACEAVRFHAAPLAHERAMLLLQANAGRMLAAVTRGGREWRCRGNQAASPRIYLRAP